jgi:inhibitor of cysteine peptidase
MKKLLTLLAIVLSSVVIIAIWNTSTNISDLVQTPADQTEQVLKLPTVDSVDKLNALITEAQNNGSVTRGLVTGMYGGAQNQALSADSSISKSAASDYSQTNIQVQGVDEADLVKSDGSYIYQVNGQNVLIIQAQPAENLKVMSRLSFEQEFFPRDLYVTDNKLVVIGSANSFKKPQTALPQPSLGGAVSDMAFAPGSGAACAIVFDLSDKSNPKQLRRVELTGNYLTSRKIGSTLYLIANKYADIYRIMNQQPENPEYKDSILGDKPLNIDYTKISYFPDSVEANYLLIGALDLNSTKEMQVSSYLGAGHNVYSSVTNLYVAVTEYEKLKPVPQGDSSKALILPSKVNTSVYRFNLEQGQVKLSAKGDVPGTILNQYSMDEAEGYFRIATTNNDLQANSVVSNNNLYILDSALKLTGKLENLAPGERIYSARFIGNRGYLVTFKTVDPLFVVDLANPKEPKVLGSLKIPGFSTYLHPYSETELIGFGQDTTEVKDSKGNIRPKVGGIKLSLFDVSDVSNPREKFREVIGDQGTYSDLLYNPKALLFSKEKNIMAFPVSVTERPKQSKAGQIGNISFQGAYVYSLDQAKGFVLKGRVTHLTEQDYRNKTKNWNSFTNHSIERAMYIGDTLYTLSKEQIKANELASLKELKTIDLK